MGLLKLLKRFHVVVAVVLLPIAMTACGDTGGTEPVAGGDDSPADSPKPSNEASDEVEDLGTLRVGMGARASNFAPTFLAEHLGLYEARGLEVEHVELGDPGQLPTLLETGEIDVSVSSSPAQLAAMGRGLDARVVATAGDALLPLAIVVRPNEFDAIEDLRGSTFAVSRPGSGGHYALLRMLEHLGWEEGNDFQISPVGGLEAHTAALSQGEVDAFLWPVEAPAQLQEQGEVEILGTVGDVVGDTGLLQQTIIAGEPAINDKPDQLQAYLDAFFEAARWTRENPEEWQSWFVDEFDVSPFVAEQTYDVFLDIWNLTGEPSEEALSAMAEAVAFLDEDTDTPPDPAQFYDDSFVPVAVESSS